MGFRGVDAEKSGKVAGGGRDFFISMAKTAIKYVIRANANANANGGMIFEYYAPVMSYLTMQPK